MKNIHRYLYCLYGAHNQKNTYTQNLNACVFELYACMYVCDDGGARDHVKYTIKTEYPA